jgi:tetratricopeptide (TPR) repeat protein
VIDLLANGAGFTVLRRENGLEYAMLDGVLTAVIQPEGLQVGDIVDMATTVKSIEPALGGNSEAFMLLGAAARVTHYRMRAEWADTLPVQWREGQGLPPIHPRQANGTTQISVSLDNVEPTILPKSAPPRFALTRVVEMTTFKSWDQLSALFAPLYSKAETLKPDSPLKAQIATIAAASADPVKRAESALALVQNQVRYVFLGMNDGGLVPADAELTWQRRFADCKGKTVLLLSLLHGLGIEAEPAIVSTVMGDGLDRRLPMAGYFNHVIVRATIGGKVYWLDGTRTGDTSLAGLDVPDFRFALPLRAAGATLAALVVPVPDKPLTEYRYRIDMTGGVSAPLPFHVEEITRGDAAVATHLSLDEMTPQVRDEALRRYFVGQYSDVEPKSVTFSWDPQKREQTLVMDGLEKHDWQYWYEPDNTRVGWDADFSRVAGPDRDAPFAVDFPDYSVTHGVILLPNGGKGFVNKTVDVDRTVAGIEYHRHAKLDGATFTIDRSERALVREFPASDAPAAQEALRALAKQRAGLTFDQTYVLTAEEKKSWLNSTPQTPLEYYRRAMARSAANDMTGAMADLDKAIETNPDYGEAFLARGAMRAQAGRLDDALADFRRVVALIPARPEGHMALAEMLSAKGQSEEALTELDRAIALNPDDPRALSARGEFQRRLGHFEQALSDTEKALAKSPEQPLLFNIYQTRINAQAALGRQDKAIDEGKALVAAKPQWDEAHILLGATLVHSGRREEGMAEFDRAIALKPSVEAYLTRANDRLPNDLAGKRADLEAALKLDPKSSDAKALWLHVEYKAANYPKVIARAGAMLSENPKDSGALLYRGLAYAATAHAAEADRDFEAARKLNEGNAGALNNLCWSKAIMGAALQSALEDCDAALKLRPDIGNMVDSRAFVLFRLGRYADALATYDRAIALIPRLAASLYMRGVTKHRLGKTTEGDADIAAAKAINAHVDREFTEAGITP